MNHHHFKRFFVLVAALIMNPICTHADDMMNLRGERYCEIIIPKSLSEYAVYNTIGLNDCPELIWQQITVARVKQETGARLVHLNGPRYWMIDGIKNSHLVSTNIKTIGGLKFREAGVLRFSMLDLIKSKSPYKERVVDRHTTWVYQPGKSIYELIDPSGKVFVMQSYSTQLVPQSQESLGELGTKLKLPKGWRFKTGTLKKLELLKAINNQATVIQDDFLNTYQMASHDFLG